MPPLADSSRPGLRRRGAGERAPFVSEQLALDQRFGQTGAIERQEGRLGPVGLGVQAAGEDLLAHARLTQDEDVDAGRRRPGAQPQGDLHLRIAAAGHVQASGIDPARFQLAVQVGQQRLGRTAASGVDRHRGPDRQAGAAQAGQGLTDQTIDLRRLHLHQQGLEVAGAVGGQEVRRRQLAAQHGQHPGPGRTPIQLQPHHRKCAAGDRRPGALVLDPALERRVRGQPAHADRGPVLLHHQHGGANHHGLAHLDRGGALGRQPLVAHADAIGASGVLHLEAAGVHPEDGVAPGCQRIIQLHVGVAAPADGHLTPVRQRNGHERVGRHHQQVKAPSRDPAGLSPLIDQRDLGLHWPPARLAQARRRCASDVRPEPAQHAQQRIVPSRDLRGSGSAVAAVGYGKLPNQASARSDCACRWASVRSDSGVRASPGNQARPRRAP